LEDVFLNCRRDGRILKWNERTIGMKRRIDNLVPRPFALGTRLKNRKEILKTATFGNVFLSSGSTTGSW
jgi:hypothetical protein